MQNQFISIIQTEDHKPSVFLQMLDSLRNTGLDLRPDFAAIVREVRGDEGKLDFPSFDELRAHYRSFMTNK